jgi:hypothetical protein
MLKSSKLAKISSWHGNEAVYCQMPPKSLQMLLKTAFRKYSQYRLISVYFQDRNLILKELRTVNLRLSIILLVAVKKCPVF